jgi:hypothetical protein
MTNLISNYNIDYIVFRFKRMPHLIGVFKIVLFFLPRQLMTLITNFSKREKKRVFNLISLGAVFPVCHTDYKGHVVA